MPAEETEGDCVPGQGWGEGGLLGLSRASVGLLRSLTLRS